MDLTPYVENVRRNTAELKRRNAEVTARARAELPKIVEALRADSRIKIAYLFGSLVKDTFHPRSDIDIAVSGLDFIECDRLSEKLGELSSFRVDVRDLDGTPEFRELVEFYGERLDDIPDRFRTMGKEIEADLAAVGRMMENLADARTRLPADPTEENLSHVGYLMHGIYTGWESAFHRIAVAFENQLDPGEWQAQLLRRMTLDIPTIRPAVIDQDMFEHLAALRSFRDIFRYSYGVRLRWRKMEIVLEDYDVVAGRESDGLRRFLLWVDQLVDTSTKKES